MSSRVSILVIWLSVVGLLGLGLIMVTSTSAWSLEGADYGLLRKQALFAVLGLVGAIIISMIDYHRIRPHIWWIFGMTLIVLALCYVPGIRKQINGEYRWIGTESFGFQPSECAKLVVVVMLAYWYSSHKNKVKTFMKGFIAPAILCGFPILLIFGEKDMGTAVALAVAAGCVMFAGGTRIFYLLGTAFFAISGLALAVFSNPNRRARMMSFQDLEETRLAQGLQQWRALLAMSNGGVNGVGLGNSSEKHGFLPYAHTDFIFAPIGEELGLYGTMGVLLGYGLIVFWGIMLAIQTKDTFGRLIVIGVVFIIFCPAMLNIAVVTACLPNSGLPLPFISCGGTNLIFTLAAVGVLASVQRWSVTEDPTFLPPLRRRKLGTSDSGQIHL